MVKKYFILIAVNTVRILYDESKIFNYLNSKNWTQ